MDTLFRKNREYFFESNLMEYYLKKLCKMIMVVMKFNVINLKFIKINSNSTGFPCDFE